MMTRALKTIMATMLCAIVLTNAGCSSCAKIFHMTAISYFPHKKSALCPPEPVPHFANPQFFGHYGTCWHEWPEGWVDCPCDIVYEEAVPGPALKEVPMEQHLYDSNELAPEHATPHEMEIPAPESTLPESTLPDEPSPVEPNASDIESDAPAIPAPDELEAPSTEPEDQSAPEESEPPQTGRRTIRRVKPIKTEVPSVPIRQARFMTKSEPRPEPVKEELIVTPDEAPAKAPTAQPILTEASVSDDESQEILPPDLTEFGL